MDDPRLVAKLRSHFLIGPPTPGSTHQGYNLAEPDVEDTSMGQAKKIRSILNDKRNGTFIECGALDGEIRSNTLYFERYLDWNGLLIEADPLNFAQMMEKNRKAWLSPTCLSIKSYPEIVSFEQNQNMGKISDNAAGIQIPGHVDVQCFPLYTYMLALNLTHVDYFSLDVEGNELDVLETIPFDKVNIETLSVEFVHVARGQDALKDFMSSKGYKIHSKVTHPNWLANDFIFVKA
ncbi:hypothetical protein AAG570_004574 [Ranatra chinensis]|uniref:Methyltransferase FkbM domain-containing protein n=1 Tax=Ranatra chinensis TaxID=642074 RepID=A0ABD0Y1K2_9HEMI